jgi:ATP-dependent DNA helicase RecG
VAAIAAAGVARAGFASAYLAPTEILAAQQQAAFVRFFGSGTAGSMSGGADVGLLTASTARLGEEDVPRKRLLEAVADGRVRCLVGTHALLGGLEIPDLALVVVDEQHRFGVQQRKALLDRAPAPHLLSMTATPIPRSLALTMYGDLDLSVLDQMPSGRKPVVTRLAFGKDLPAAWKHVAEQIAARRQAFVVCPLVDPSDALGAKSVAETSKTVARALPKSVRIGVLHGKLPADEKAAAITAFRSGATDVLVSTTVVEVGVDVPNATVMVVMGAERFGLSQLHQLRGRVGRSGLPSWCYLAPDGWSPAAKERLTAMTRTNDGFELAEIDLRLRGAGNMFGTAQSGFPDFRLANEGDVDLMKKTRDVAARLLADDPDLLRHPLLRDQVKVTFDEVHLE